MNRSSVLSFTLATALGLTLAYPPASLADDTEIYLGNDNLHEGVRPNILFILDTSGSMSNTVDGTGMDRLDNMKVAIKGLLDEINNVNVGLMRFTDPGGPILFPVSYIDEDITLVEDGGAESLDVNVRIDQPSDDAEESVFSGAVNLSSPVLDLVVSPGTPASTTTVTSRISASLNDVEEHESDGAIGYPSSATFEIGHDAGQEDQLVGLRFTNVQVPKDATIVSAELEFTAREAHSAVGFTWRIRGQDIGNAPIFTSASYNASDRTSTGAARTSAEVQWADPDPWSIDSLYTSPDVSAIVQEIVNRADWVSGNALVMTIDNTSSSSGSDTKMRVAHSYDSNSAKAPLLRVEYTTAAVPAEVVTVGLRFRNVAIPQGAAVSQAFIEFWPNTDESTLAHLNIEGEASDDAATFQSTAFDLSNTTNRPRTSANVDWKPSPWTAGTAEQTVDLTDIVQEIVDRPGWCGNNAMAFFIRPDDINVGPRIADSFDSNPTNAPILRVEFDEDGVSPSACIDQWVQRSVTAGDDDAEEDESDGDMLLNGSVLDLANGNLSGMRFANLPIHQGQEILEARLVLTAQNDDSGASTLSLYGEATDDAAAFTNTDDDLSSRADTTATVSWTPSDWLNNLEYESPDLKTVIQEIVDRPGWTPDNALVLVVEHDANNDRRARTFDDNPSRAAVLKVKVRGTLSTGGSGVKTVRTLLKEIVDNFDHQGHTPIVDTLYEATRYFRGDDVYWGKMRGHERDGTYDPNPNADNTNTNVRRNTRLSHAASYSGGSLSQPDGCDVDDLNAAACIDELITGTPEYLTPIDSECQTNFIVLLTDGEANHNHSEDLIKSYIDMDAGDACTEGDADENCGTDLVKWLYDTDHEDTVAGKNNVVTYTVGFNFSSQWLRDLATVGGGEYHEADTADELKSVLKAALGTMYDQATSFATPSLSVNAFNKLFHRSDVYFALFQPDKTVGWDGNVKKYQLCDVDNSEQIEGILGGPDDDPFISGVYDNDGNYVCALGEVLDANDEPAIETDPASPFFGRIRNEDGDEALSFWTDSANPDGAEIKEGGAGHELPAPSNRKVLTYTATAAPVNVALTAAENVLTDADNDGVLDNVAGATLAERRLRTQQLFGDPDAHTTDAERDELIRWLKGEDVDDIEEIDSLASADRRYAFNDPLHSSPTALTFGGDEANPVIRLFVGTNGGGLRMLDAESGAEQWVFYPQATLANQLELRDDPTGDHLYGLDGTPTAWINDTNHDGLIDDDEGDFVHLFLGMRRGGHHLYALDVTPADHNNPGDIAPVLKWRLDGASDPFERLGQTWSRPRLLRLRVGTATANESEVRDVLAFAGGYDTVQDGAFTPSGLGNALYLVDPANGALLFVISGTDHGETEQIVVPDMDYPIPSDLAAMDANGDGLTDRLFVGDTGGQLWRIDLAPDLGAASPGLSPVVAKFATVSDSAEEADQRKFFYPPEVVRVTSGEYNSYTEYDLVVAVTGNRAHPLDEDVQNRIFAFRDTDLGPLADANGDGLADAYTTLQGALADGTAGDLLDVTDILDFTDSANVSALEAQDGWYINLEDTGEKALATPVIVDGKLFATSYIPEGVINEETCSLNEGNGRLYGMNVLNGAPLEAWNDLDGDDTTLSKADRAYALAGGIPSQAVPIFQPEGVTLLIGGGGGASAINPDIELPRSRSYWYQSLNMN